LLASVFLIDARKTVQKRFDSQVDACKRRRGSGLRSRRALYLVS
jgi:hypothetical protein